MAGALPTIWSGGPSGGAEIRRLMLRPPQDGSVGGWLLVYQRPVRGQNLRPSPRPAASLNLASAQHFRGVTGDRHRACPLDGQSPDALPHAVNKHAEEIS